MRPRDVSPLPQPPRTLTLVRTLALDPTTGDLLLTAGRLSLWAGECFTDTAVGVPFLTFLGAKGGERMAGSQLRKAILTCPGVTALEAFAFVVAATLAAGVTLPAGSVAGNASDPTRQFATLEAVTSTGALLANRASSAPEGSRHRA